MSSHIFHVFSMFSHFLRPCHLYVIRLSSFPRLRRQLVPSARFSVVELREAFGEVLAAREKRGRRLMAPGTERWDRGGPGWKNAGNSGGKWRSLRYFFVVGVGFKENLIIGNPALQPDC
jgi:hypothetical protein